jgi:hypothetical protein
MFAGAAHGPLSSGRPGKDDARGPPAFSEPATGTGTVQLNGAGSATTGYEPATRKGVECRLGHGGSIFKIAFRKKKGSATARLCHASPLRVILDGPNFRPAGANFKLNLNLLVLI